MNKQTYIKKLREVCTYSSDEGTSGYLLSEDQFEALYQLHIEGVREAYHDGFLKGFDDCKKLVESGEHSHCCIIPNKNKQREKLKK